MAMSKKDSKEGNQPTRWVVYKTVVLILGSAIIVYGLWDVIPPDATLLRAASLIGGILTAWGASVALGDYPL